MYYKLKEDFMLRGWDKLPYALVNRRTKRTQFLRKNEMDALMLCDGTVDISLPFIPKEIRDMIPVIEKNGIIEKCSAGEKLEKNQEYVKYPARYIRTAHWSITGKCNYRCKHCYMSAPDAKLGELSHETVMDIIDQLGKCGIMNVSLTGGEPLVRRDFMEIVDALLERDIRITQIYSNGKLVTDQLLDALLERGIRPEFNMSYDGAGYHDWLRGIPGAEEIVKDAFIRCHEKGFPTGAEMCLFGENNHTLLESVKNLAEWGCTHVKITPVSNVGAWKDGGYGEAMTPKDLYELYMDFLPGYYESGMPLAIQLGGFFSASPAQPDSYDIPVYKSCGDLATTCICGHARMVMYISAEGRALPCMALSGMGIQEEFPLIPELGLARCITDSRYMKLINTRATEYLEHNKKCQKCEYAANCIGGCRASALETSPDDIMAPDMYTCEMFQNGWITKIVETMKKVRPSAKCRIPGFEG